MSEPLPRPALAIVHTSEVKSRTHDRVTSRRLTGIELEAVIRDVAMVVDHHRRHGAKAEHARELAGLDLGLSPRGVRSLLDEPHLANVTRAEADRIKPAFLAFLMRAAADLEARAAQFRRMAEGVA